jgi:DNA-binding MarR family transcriptional regulator
MSEASPSIPNEEAAAVQALIRIGRLLEKATSRLSLSDFRVLSAIQAGEERASRVAARLSIGRPTISATVDSLCRRGLLERREVHHDQRADSLVITAEGVVVRDEVESELAQVVKRLSIRAGQLESIMHSLALLGGAIEEEMREHATDLTRAQKATARA